MLHYKNTNQKLPSLSIKEMINKMHSVLGSCATKVKPVDSLTRQEEKAGEQNKNDK